MVRWIVALFMLPMMGAQIKPFAQNLEEHQAQYDRLNYQIARQRSQELLNWIRTHQVEGDQIRIIADRLNRLAQCLEVIAARTVTGAVNHELRQEARVLRRAARDLVVPFDDLRLTSPVRRYPSWHRSPQ